MNTTKSNLLAVTIILFALGLWPVALITAIVAITLAEVISHQTKKQIQELKTEIQKLREELAQVQAEKRD